MPLPSELIVAISRAYALTEIIPLRHPTIRDALRSVDRLLHETSEVTVSVTESGLELQGDEIEDHQGLAREFARDLRAVEARELGVTAETGVGDVESFIVALRNTISGVQVEITDGLDPDPEGGLRLRFRNGDEVRFAGEPEIAVAGGLGPEDAEGLAGSINRLFEGDTTPEDSTPEGEPGEEIAPDAPEEGEDRPEASEGEEEDERRGIETFRTGELAEAARAFLQAGTGERASIREGLIRDAEACVEEGRLDPVVNAVQTLARGGVDDPGDDEAVDLARRLITPRVAHRFVGRLAGVWDELERAELLKQVHLLASEMAEPVAEALSEARDRRARRTYMDAMLAMGETGLEVVEEMLEDPRWFVVRNAVSILGEVGGERAVEHLTSTLAHDDARVRRETVLALAKIGGEDAGDLVLGKLEDPDPSVRSAATRAVGVLQVERAVRPLLERLENETDDEVIEQIIRSLGQIGDPGAVPVIEKYAVPGFFSRPARDIRIAAYRALASIGTPHARKLLEQARDDRDTEVRNAVETFLE